MDDFNDWPVLDGTERQAEVASRIREKVVDRLLRYMEQWRFEEEWQDAVIIRMSDVTSSGAWFALKDLAPFKVFVRFLQPGDFLETDACPPPEGDPDDDGAAAQHAEAAQRRLAEMQAIASEVREGIRCHRKAALRTTDVSERRNHYLAALQLRYSLHDRLNPWPSRQCGRRKTDGNLCRGSAKRCLEDPVCSSHLSPDEQTCAHFEMEHWNDDVTFEQFGLTREHLYSY